MTTLTVEMITFDCLDPDNLAQWWSRVLDAPVHPVAPGEFVMVVQESGPRLGFQRVEDPTPGKNRVHLDFAAPDLDREVHGWCPWARWRPAATTSGRSSPGRCCVIPTATRSAWPRRPVTRGATG